MRAKYKILYVDDEPLNLMLFSRMFNATYDVVTAESGIEGLEILKENQMDVVLSDMKMPRMNGLEFIEKAKVQYPGILYYILTGFEITREIKAALNENLIDKYFQKPFDMHEIHECILKGLGEDGSI